ncbi:MAG TPA: hypothetical protein VH877_02820 [Polyangia bacterium]|jgi:hypothetical protein|nr:hypothetical protein [Polyangia bacterium]
MAVTLITELDGTRLEAVGRAARAVPAGSNADTGAHLHERTPIYQALLTEPLAIALLGPGAPAGPSLRLPGTSGPTRLVTSLVGATSLGGAIVQLFAATRRLRDVARQGGLWPDGVERMHVFAPGSVFPLLRSHPGATLELSDGSVSLDAGEITALAEGQTPSEFVETLRQLVIGGRGQEAARHLSQSMLYVLGHPQGGMVILQGELPVFLHLQEAVAFAARMAAQLGRGPDQAAVAAGELFRMAIRGKLAIVVGPGPGALRLRYLDLR